MTLPAQTSDRHYDIVLFGATSFVGKLTAQYLSKFVHEHAKDVKFAIAGRSQNKLNAVNASLTQPVDTLIADSDDPVSIDAMAKQTKVMISTVGPYLKYGESLVKACCHHGTDYVDLSGEALFIKDMLDHYQADAKASGARIINSCGFDSIPSDLGVYWTQQLGKQTFGYTFNTIHMRVKVAKGGLSGGTIASMATLFETISKDEEMRQHMSDPYLLNDDPNSPTIKQNHIRIPKYDPVTDRWTAPFVMSAINTRIVHRTNQLLDYEYGRTFKYDEAIFTPANTKGRLMGYGVTLGTYAFATAMSFEPSRDLLKKHVLPKSGTGPSQQKRDNGYFDLRFYASGDNTPVIETKVTGSKDPGYGSTSMMLAQAALCLLQDVDKDSVPGGFWTPAAAMGEALIDRLEQHAGMQFSQVSS